MTKLNITPHWRVFDDPDQFGHYCIKGAINAADQGTDEANAQLMDTALALLVAAREVVMDCRYGQVVDAASDCVASLRRAILRATGARTEEEISALELPPVVW